MYQPNYFVSIILLINAIVWLFALRDCWYNAKKRKEIWLVIILFTGVLGWLVFYYAGDRTSTQKVK